LGYFGGHWAIVHKTIWSRCFPPVFSIHMRIEREASAAPTQTNGHSSATVIRVKHRFQDFFKFWDHGFYLLV
jgi:hypothetical protein